MRRWLGWSLLVISWLPFQAIAALPEVTIDIRNNLFLPQTVRIPANKKVRLTFINHDPTPEEIDSFDLNREKVIFANSRGTIFVGPLPPGEYHFFGEFHPNSAVGVVLVTEEQTEETANAN
ncbi:MAG: cupredoxin domain-containing protein [Alteromonadaceae bacterium]|nr:cupredoxin domain-containing protein [Alteromonadaceae bacterium]